MPAPKGKHLFGTVKVGEKGQIVIPKEARELFGIQPGDSLVVLGDEATSGLAIIKNDMFLAQVAGAIFQQTGVPEGQFPPEAASEFEEIKELASRKVQE
jgi:AbrB family looped-hinge helix DNA binding protein